MFNTGTVVGISCNIFGSGFPGNFIPSFSWGGAAGFETYRLTNAVETIRIGMELHNMSLIEADRIMLEQIFMRSGRYLK